MGWDIELSCPSMVYALLLKSKQASMIGKYHAATKNSRRSNTGGGGRYHSGTRSSFRPNDDTNNNDDTTLPSLTIQQAIQEHLLWSSSLSSSSMPSSLSESNDSNHENDNSYCQVGESYNDGTKKEAQQQVYVAEYNMTDDEEEKNIVMGSNISNDVDNDTSRSNAQGHPATADIRGSSNKQWVDRHVRIGWKMVHVEELRRAVSSGDGGRVHDNRRTRHHHRRQPPRDNNDDDFDFDVDSTGVVYNIDRNGNRNIPIIVDDSMVRFENCPPSINTETLLYMLSRYDLAEYPSSDGNSVMVWKQSTEDGKYHHMYIVRFADAAWARAAIRELQGKEIDGKVIRLIQFPKQLRSKKESNVGAAAVATVR
jgi:hypothetical protein